MMKFNTETYASIGDVYDTTCEVTSMSPVRLSVQFRGEQRQT